MTADQTPNLELPYIMAAQAQKHVTHNEAIRALDAVVQLAVLDRDLSAPPATPSEGDRYIVGPSPTGAWADHAGSVAAWQDGAWELYEPRPGWLAWVIDEASACVWNGSAWSTYGAGITSVNPIAMVGVNATADATNRLSVASAATLLNHEGAGHQLKLNKSTASDTASLLLQTGFSGRAELGTAGDDHFHIKVSADGSSWTEALRIDASNGNVGLGVMPGGYRLDAGTQPIRAGSGLFERPAGVSSEFYFGRTGAGIRWNFGMSGTAESGSNAGSDFYLNRYSDAGVYLGTPFQIVRSSGEFRLIGTQRTQMVRPNADNTFTLGESGGRYSAVWAANGTIQTSDARDKTDIERLSAEVAAGLVDSVEPVTFRWIEGGRVVTGYRGADDSEPGAPITEARPGVRRHAGFLAQEIKQSLDAADIDFGAWGLEDVSNSDSRQWLRPDQLIPVLWAALRETRQELAALSARLTASGGGAA